MKRWIHCSITTDEVRNQIENMVYQTYDNYKGDGLSRDDIVTIVIEHLEEIYDLVSGVDYSISDIVDEVEKYEWY